MSKRQFALAALSIVAVTILCFGLVVSGGFYTVVGKERYSDAVVIYTLNKYTGTITRCLDYGDSVRTECGVLE